MTRTHRSSMRAFLSKKNCFLGKNRSNLIVGDKEITSRKTAYRPWLVRRIFTLSSEALKPLKMAIFWTSGHITS